jgi:hypothetical protein
VNPIDPNMRIGTLGELLVQLRLLQYDVQAAVPLKDSGNDLIAVKGNVFRAIQVKTTTGDRFDCSGLAEKKYHVLALVRLIGEDLDIFLDQCEIFLVSKEMVGKAGYRAQELSKFALSAQIIDRLFGERQTA